MFGVERRLIAGNNDCASDTVIRCDRDAATYRGRESFIGFMIGREYHSIVWL